MTRGSSAQETIEGEIGRYKSWNTRYGHIAHEFRVGSTPYTLFSEDPAPPLAVGDRARFVAKKKRPRSSRGRTYYNIVPGTIELLRPNDAAKSDEGSIYILTNPAMRGLLKIGFTRESPQARARQLSSNTSVPQSFQVAWSMFVRGNPERIERAVHGELAAYRANKEFFRVNVDTAKTIVQSAYARLYPDEAQHIDAKIRKREHEKKHARARARAAEEEKRKLEEWGNSPEGQWATKGTVKVCVKAHSGPTPERPGLFARALLGSKVPDWATITISGRHGPKRKQQHPWKLTLRGYCDNQPLLVGPQEGVPDHQYSTMDAAVKAACDVLRNARFRTVRIDLDIDCKLLQEPRIPSEHHLSQERGDYTLEMNSLFGFRIKNEPQLDLSQLECALLEASGCR